MLTKEEQDKILVNIAGCIKFLAKKKKVAYVEAIRLLIQDNITQSKIIERVANEQRDANKTEG